MDSITGSTKWDIFVVYILVCTVFIAFCCVCVIFMFWCCPARDPSGGAALSAGGGRDAIHSGVLQISLRIHMRRSDALIKEVHFPFLLILTAMWRKFSLFFCTDRTRTRFLVR